MLHINEPSPVHNAIYCWLNKYMNPENVGICCQVQVPQMLHHTSKIRTRKDVTRWIVFV